MNQAEMIALIGKGVTDITSASVWADLGAGWGNFTRALRTLIGNEATIYAVDRDEKAFEALRQQHGTQSILHTLTADFTEPLNLPALDGILMANALHFIQNQQAVLQQLRHYLKPKGRLIVVEYDFTHARPWVPYPIPQNKFTLLASTAGFARSQILNTRRSPSTGAVMYSGAAFNAYK